MLIIANQGSDCSTYAAGLCANYSVVEGEGNDAVTYGGWYLPSKYELKLMYVNLHTNSNGNFADNWYWSSTESNSYDAWSQSFSGGGQSDLDKSYTYYVRAVRVF